MKTKIKYEPDGHVILGGIEWNWDTLRELCFSDYVYEGRPRGTVYHKFKVPREILNEWIEIEDWETARKSHWQRPYSYRIDGDLSNLLQNITKLIDIQKEVNDIDFQPDNLLSRVTINIDIKDENQFKNLKTIVIEKYRVIIQDEPDEFGQKMFEDEEEIRYKTEVKNESVTLKFSKVASKKTKLIMTENEKLDNTLKLLYIQTKDGGMTKIIQGFANKGLVLTIRELQAIKVKIEAYGYASFQVRAKGKDYSGEITKKGIAFVESNSFSQPGISILDL